MSKDDSKPAIAIIIGAMKGGTTAMFDYLSNHPEICACIKKESGYFCRPDWVESLDGYWELFPWDESRHRIRLEASPAYTYEKVPTIARIATHCPQAKLIYMMRDPIARIDSQLLMMHAGRQPFEPYMPLHEGLLDVCRYYSWIQRVLEHFPEDQLLLLRSEDVREDTDGALMRVCSFLDISTEVSGLQKVNRHANSKEEQKLRMTPVYSVLRMFKLTKVVGFIFFALPKEMQQRLTKKLIPGAREVQGLSDAEKLYVIQELGSEMQLLAEKCGISLDGWDLDASSYEGASKEYPYFKELSERSTRE